MDINEDANERTVEVKYKVYLNRTIVDKNEIKWSVIEIPIVDENISFAIKL